VCERGGGDCERGSEIVDEITRKGLKLRLKFSVHCLFA
jgi:hypothetical protein